MAFLILGILLLLMKFAEFGPVAEWSWVWVLLPFGLAAAWWAFADSSGLTQRRAIDKMEERKRSRRERDMKALGLDVRRDRRVRVLKERPVVPPPPPPAPAPTPAARRDPKL
jgi:small Trp-rich protein